MPQRTKITPSGITWIIEPDGNLSKTRSKIRHARKIQITLEKSINAKMIKKMRAIFKFINLIFSIHVFLPSNVVREG